jgi:hypothetical protein
MRHLVRLKLSLMSSLLERSPPLPQIQAARPADASDAGAQDSRS